MVKKEHAGKIKEKIIPAKIREITEEEKDSENEESELESEVKEAEQEEVKSFRESISSSPSRAAFPLPPAADSDEDNNLAPVQAPISRREERVSNLDRIYTSSQGGAASSDERERFYREMRQRVVSQEQGRMSEPVQREVIENSRGFVGSELTRANVQKEVHDTESRYHYRSETVSSVAKRRKTDLM